MLPAKRESPLREGWDSKTRNKGYGEPHALIPEGGIPKRHNRCRTRKRKKREKRRDSQERVLRYMNDRKPKDSGNQGRIERTTRPHMKSRIEDFMSRLAIATKKMKSLKEKMN